MKPKKVRLVRKRFVEWLQSRLPFAMVGKAVNPTSCPLACYLSTLVPEDVTVEVNLYSYLLQRDPENFVWMELPKWAYEFVHGVDDDPDRSSNWVTREEALSVLGVYE